MKSRKDIFKSFGESFRNMEGSFHVLEHSVPVEQQMEYFKFSDKVRRNLQEAKEIDYEKYMDDLKNSESSREDKRKSLSILAASKQVKVFRFLEQYAKETESELSDWATMALMESRVILESDLSGEKQIFISTGLGGKGDRLRFYALIISALQTPFADYQKKVINDELDFALIGKNCELEDVRIGDRYVEVVVLMPFTVDLKGILDDVIAECNQYGNFLREVNVITNVEELEAKDIEVILKKYDAEKKKKIRRL